LLSVKGPEKCALPLIPAELPEWQIFYVELMRQLDLDPDQHYKHLFDGKRRWDSKITDVERKLSNLISTRHETGLDSCSLRNSAAVFLILNKPPIAMPLIAKATVEAVGMLKRVPSATGAGKPIKETPNQPLALMISALF
jgi:hypothetical protein